MYLNLGKPTLYTWRIVGLQCICGSVKKPWEKYNPAAAGLLDRHVYHTPIWAAEGWGQLLQQPLHFYRSELQEWKIHIWLTFHVTTWSKIYSCDVHTLRTPWQNLSTQSIITAWSMLHYIGQQHHWQHKWDPLVAECVVLFVFGRWNTLWGLASSGGWLVLAMFVIARSCDELWGGKWPLQERWFCGWQQPAKYP